MEILIPLGVWVVYRVMSGCLDAMVSSDTMEKVQNISSFLSWFYAEKD